MVYRKERGLSGVSFVFNIKSNTAEDKNRKYYFLNISTRRKLILWHFLKGIFISRGKRSDDVQDVHYD